MKLTQFMQSQPLVVSTINGSGGRKRSLWLFGLRERFWSAGSEHWARLLMFWGLARHLMIDESRGGHFWGLSKAIVGAGRGV